MDVYAQIAIKIIESQEVIIGPVAIEQAKQVPNLKIDWTNRTVIITGDKAAVINQLVEKYRSLFGQISVELSKESTMLLMSQLPPDTFPETLR